MIRALESGAVVSDIRVRVRVETVITRRFCTCVSYETKLLKWKV